MTLFVMIERVFLFYFIFYLFLIEMFEIFSFSFGFSLISEVIVASLASRFGIS